MKNSGFVLLNKPSGVSSRGAGGRIARMFNAKTFGHIGTLDPMASGLLIIALNEATKVIPCIPDARKEYEFSVRWGIETDTLDTKGLVTKQDNHLEYPSNETLQNVCNKFIGEYDQVPPNFSAVHIDGQRAYKLTLAGKKFDIPARRVHIYEKKL
jgi:tRNA pseudouridine55 synthase